MSEAAITPSTPAFGPVSAQLLSDDRLALRATKGDQRALRRDLSSATTRISIATARRSWANAEDAQDAVQNTMVKVLRALPGEQRAAKLKPWLYRIAHNEAID